MKYGRLSGIIVGILTCSVLSTGAFLELKDSDYLLGLPTMALSLAIGLSSTVGAFYSLDPWSLFHRWIYDSA